MPTTIDLTSEDDISMDHHDKVICQFCTRDLSTMTLPQKEYHYDQHFSEDSSPSQTSRSELSGGNAGPSEQTSKPPSKTGYKVYSKPLFKPHSKYFERQKSGIPGQSLIFPKSSEGKNVFWHSFQTTEPPSNFTPGLITVLKHALARSHDKGTIQRAWLAFEHSVHVYRESWDLTWGCGYRNYLMACAALMDQQTQPMYFPLLDAPVPPGVRNLQILLERAWRDGYDQVGAEQLHHKLVDTTKWIGTAELCVAFTYRGIPAKLVDFELSDGPDPLLQWIHNYFSGGDPKGKNATVNEALRGVRPVTVTDRLPIILQYEGHSKAVVGVILKNRAYELLVFDPARQIPPDIREAGLRYHDVTRMSHARSLPSKIIQKVKHVVGAAVKSNKRRTPEPHPGASKKKRVDNQNVIVITDDDPDDHEGEEEEEDVQVTGEKPQRPWSDTLDPGNVIKIFRTENKKLNKDKYQILYFPLVEPLTEAQRLQQRVVTGEKVC